MERNTRRIPQAPLTRRQIRLHRKRLARELSASHGVPISTIWGPLGFMVNRAPWAIVKSALESSRNDDDPIAGALERLAQV